MRRILLSSMVVSAVALAMPAAAHVTVQPQEAATSAFARFDVRVPNERDNAATVKVEVQLPESLVAVSFRPTPGWKRTVERKPRSAPVEVFGEQVSDYIASVTWEGGRIEPGEFEEFGFTARTPEEAGTLTFPAVQTYEGGEVVRWIGPADADEPAARVTLAAASSEEGSHGESDEEDDGDVPPVVPWAALTLSVLALGVVVVGRWRS